MDSHTLEDTISKIRFITTKPTGEECGELCDSAEADMDIGNTNDFEVTIAVSDYDTERMDTDAGYSLREQSMGELLETSNLYPVHEKLHCVEEHGEECWSTR